jgi:hypothetical protein
MNFVAISHSFHGAVQYRLLIRNRTGIDTITESFSRQIVTPAEAGVQRQFTTGILKILDSGFHRNDTEKRLVLE